MCVCERTFFFLKTLKYSTVKMHYQKSRSVVTQEFSTVCPRLLECRTWVLCTGQAWSHFFSFSMCLTTLWWLCHILIFFSFVCSSRVCQHHFCCWNGVAHYLLYNYCYQSWKTAGALVRCAVFLAAVTCRFSRCWPVMEQKKVYIIGQGNESFHSSPPPYHPPTLPNWSAWSAPVLSMMKGGRVRWNSSVGNISV